MSSGAKAPESWKGPKDPPSESELIRDDERKRRSFSPPFKRQERPKRTFPEYDVKPEYSYTFSETAEEGEAILPNEKEREREREREPKRESRERKSKRFERRNDSSSERSDRSRERRRERKIKKHKRDHS